MALAGNESAKAEVHLVITSAEDLVGELLALTRENNALLKEIRAIFK